jgi:hypothetical protein
MLSASLLNRNLSALLDLGLQVHLLLQVPEPGVDVPRSWALQREFGIDIAMGQSKVAYLLEQSAFLALIDPPLRAQVSIIDPTPLFFPDPGRSMTIHNGLPLYYDDDHLNRHGALLLEGLLEAVVAGQGAGQQ